MATEGKERVLVCGPLGRDGKLIASTLERGGMLAEAFQDLARLCRELDVNRDGAVIITDEALRATPLSVLTEALLRQEPWSDIPVLLLTSRNADRLEFTDNLVQRLGSDVNLSLFERPLHPATLVNAVQSALRARRRQYEIREFQQDLEGLVARRTEELIAKNIELEGFTYSVSHDMRTPLRAMVSQSRILLEEQESQLDESGREGLHRLVAASLKMAQLVDDLLKYARLGGVDLRLESVNLGELAREESERLESEGKECRLEISTKGDLNVCCDPRLVGMVLANLLDNACKYRKRGTQKVLVELGSANVDGERRFYLRDNGIGFDMQYAPKLFKAFERLHRDSEYVGTGIGLANVRRAIERHGGRVWAESEPGTGATFWFTLPSA